jgi:hypothetical protein
MLKESDLKIFETIHRFPFCTVEALASFLNMSKIGLYRNVRHLAESGYLNYEYKLYNTPKSCQLTHKAFCLIEDKNIPLRRSSNLNEFNHDLKVLEVAQCLHKLGLIFQTEREYKNSHAADEFCPDLVTETDGGIVFIEIELTRKREKQLLARWDDYLSKNVDVIYFANDSVYFTYTELVKNHGFSNIDIHQYSKHLQAIGGVLKNRAQ